MSKQRPALHEPKGLVVGMSNDAEAPVTPSTEAGRRLLGSLQVAELAAIIRDSEQPGCNHDCHEAIAQTVEHFGLRAAPGWMWDALEDAVYDEPARGGELLAFVKRLRAAPAGSAEPPTHIWRDGERLTNGCGCADCRRALAAPALPQPNGLRVDQQQSLLDAGPAIDAGRLMSAISDAFKHFGVHPWYPPTKEFTDFVLERLGAAGAATGATGSGSRSVSEE